MNVKEREKLKTWAILQSEPEIHASITELLSDLEKAEATTEALHFFIEAGEDFPSALLKQAQEVIENRYTHNQREDA